MTILLTKISTPEETQGVRISSRVNFQTKLDYIPSMSRKKHEAVNNQVECENNLNPDAHMFLCQEMIEEVPDASAVIMTQLSLKLDIKR